MDALQKYISLKRSVEQAQQKADRAQGAEEEVAKQLKSEFGCTTLISAKKKAKVLKKQKEEAEEKFETAIEEFEEKWTDELG